MLSLRKQLNKVSFYCRQWMKHQTEVWSWCGASLEEGAEFVRVTLWDCAADQQALPSKRALDGRAHCILCWSAPTPVFVWRPWAVTGCSANRKMIWSRRKELFSAPREGSLQNSCLGSNLNSFPSFSGLLLKGAAISKDGIMCLCT